MAISNISPVTYSPRQSILKSANQQPELAGQLINRTVQSLSDSVRSQPVIQPTVQSVDNESMETTSDNEFREMSIDIRV